MISTQLLKLSVKMNRYALGGLFVNTTHMCTHKITRRLLAFNACDMRVSHV